MTASTNVTMEAGDSKAVGQADAQPEHAFIIVNETQLQHDGYVEVEPFRTSRKKRHATQLKRSPAMRRPAHPGVAVPQSSLMTRPQPVDEMWTHNNSTNTTYGTLPSTMSSASLLSTASTVTKRKEMDIWFVLYVLAFACFLILGSVTFRELEQDNELDERQEFRNMRDNFMRKYSNITGN